MYEDKFTAWIRWADRESADNIRYPGIYACAISPSNLTGLPFTWLQEIAYIGMTNSITGLKGRLKQFDYTIAGKTGHGGADRVRYRYNNYGSLTNNLFVAIVPFECDVKSNIPDDLRIMGEVCQFEYNCFAHYVDKFGNLPEFNNKKLSPKYSLTIGRGLSPRN